MKPRAIGLLLVLAATHVCVFFIARGQTTMNAVDTAAAASLPPAKASQREPAAKPHRLALEDLEKMPLGRAEFVELRKELFRDWIKRDPRGAMDMIYGVETHGRLHSLDWALQEELETAIAAQADEVWQWIESGRYGSFREKALHRWISALAADRQLEKLTASVLRMSGWDSRRAIDAICGQGKAQDLERLRATLAAADEEYRLLRGMGSSVQPTGYFTRLVELSGEGMPELLAREVNEDVQEELLHVWAEEDLSKRRPAEAIALLSKLPEELAREGLDDVFWSSCQRGGFTTLVDLLEASTPLAMWQGMEEEEQERLLSHAVRDAHETYWHPTAMCRELQRISDPAIRRSVFEQAGAEINPIRYQSEVVEAVAGMTAGPDRDAFIMGMLDDCYFGEPVFGELLGQIADEEARREFHKMKLEGEEEDAEEEP